MLLYSYLYFYKRISQKSIRKSIFIDFFIPIRYLKNMGERKMYNTTLDTDLIKSLKILAAQLEKRQNDLLEEAIQDLLKKYEKKDKE